MIRVAAVLLVALGLQACATLVPAPRVAPPDSPEAAIEAWARVLDTFVDERGRVDFTGLARQREDLDRYVAFVATTPPEAFTDGAQRLAHHLNAYNALSMFNVIESDIPRTHAGLRKLRFFVLREHLVGGQRLSLYQYENDVIRPIGDPRVHFALNCSAVSCPRLPRIPFHAEDLDARLDEEARRFFAEPRNFRLDAASRTVWLSEILKFYSEDFVPGHAPDLATYAGRLAPEPAPAGWRVRFTTYDWTVADQRLPPEGR